MKVALPFAALILAACNTNPQPQENDARARAAVPPDVPAQPGTPPSTPALAPPAEPIIAAALPPGPQATPGEMRTFRDWVVGCDNRLACTAVALGPDGAEFPTLRLVVMKAAGGALPRVIVDSNDDVAAPASITIDGKAVAKGGRADDEGVIFTGDDAARLIEAIAQGKAGRIVAGKADAALALNGAAAALRYMDERQRLAGTTAAMVARGKDRPTASPPALPIVTRVRPSGRAARPTAAQVTAMRRAADCQIEFLDEAQTRPEAHALGDGATLILLPCGAGAYNFMSAVFVIQGDGTLRPATFDVSTGIDSEAGTVAQLVNAGFGEGLLTSYAKGRGIGDCGVSQNFAWDGARFRLTEQGEMTECRGSTRLVTTWRAEVR
ncbi:DUF1176 domain-containing protein [Sphingomonas aestuarii]